MTIHVLEAMYDTACIGHEPSTGRAVYSLPLLARKEEARSRIKPDVAIRVICELVRKVIDEHGAEAPLFVDDSKSRVQEDKPLILLVP
jgi:hypothetical protein